MSDGGLVGQRLGPYRIDALLGEGAMGEVYRGEHEALGRPVAIKTLKPHVAADRSQLERFFAEARAVNIIRHENIVECTDMVQEPGGRSYLVMEMLEGMTLGAAIRKAGKLAPARAVEIAAQIADAIAAAHGKGIVHRDLKPENVFLIKRGRSRDYVKVLDFGIARLRPEIGGVSATQTGAVVGTPAYMSSEQARGDKAVPASDQYALGVIVFHMIAGRLPFEATALPLMMAAHIQDVPPRLDAVEPSCPRALADAVARALEKEPEARFPRLQAFRKAILTAVGLDAGDDAGEDALMATALPGAAPDAMVATELPGTAPKDAIAQSSLSGAAGAAEVSTAKPSGRRLWLAGVGALALAGAAGVAITQRGGGGGRGGSVVERAVDARPAIPPPDAGVRPVDAAIAVSAPPDAPAPVVDAAVEVAKPTRKPPGPVRKPVPSPAVPVDAGVKPPPPAPKPDAEPDRTREIIR